MDTKAFWLALAVATAIGVAIALLPRSASAQANPDAWVLAELRKAGSDLSKPHPIEFFLDFPSAEGADRMASKLKATGFQTDVKRSARGSAWTLVATKSIVPSEPDLVRLRKQFEAEARPYGGKYDGWGTPVVK